MESELNIHFLAKHGGLIVYLVFFLGLFLNGYIFILNFINGNWLLSIWSLLSIIVLPKATIGLIIVTCDFLKKLTPQPGMPLIFFKLFPKTMQLLPTSMHRHPSARRLVKELIWLGTGLFPIAYFLLSNQQYVWR